MADREWVNAPQDVRFIFESEESDSEFQILKFFDLCKWPPPPHDLPPAHIIPPAQIIIESTAGPAVYRHLVSASGIPWGASKRGGTTSAARCKLGIG